MIKNRNVDAAADIALSKIDLTSTPNDTHLQLPETITTSLPTAAAANEGAIAYDATTNTVKFSDGSAWANVGSNPGAGSVTAAMLASNAVETAKIKDANVTTAKLAAGVISADAAGRALFAAGVFDVDTALAAFGANSIAAAFLLDAIADGAFAADAATRALFGSGIWEAAQLASNSVETAKIKDLNITDGKIAAAAAVRVKIETFRFADITATDSIYLIAVPTGYTMDVIEAALLVETTVAADDTDYWSVNVRNITAGNDLLAAAKSTQITGGTAITQFVPWVLTAAQNNTAIAAQSVIALTLTKAASAANLDEPVLQLVYKLNPAA